MRLLLIIGLAAAQEDFGNMFGQAQKYCAPYKCPKDKEGVQGRLSLKAKAGGCDALNSGAGMQMFSAQDKAESPIDACCDRRQACDAICGTSTKFCDAELKSCAEAACAGAPDKEECDRKKSMMQLMQGMDQGACKRHTDGQVAACKCVAPDEAPKRRLKTLTEVYAKNKGDASKAAGLAAKADTSKKFGALLHKLVAKFPSMIKKVADPQQAYWEKIMKEGIDKKADEEVDGVEEDEDVEDLDAADEL